MYLYCVQFIHIFFKEWDPKLLQILKRPSSSLELMHFSMPDISLVPSVTQLVIHKYHRPSQYTLGFSV